MSTAIALPLQQQRPSSIEIDQVVETPVQLQPDDTRPQLQLHQIEGVSKHLWLANGKVEIDILGKEFSKYQSELAFYETPAQPMFGWLDLKQTAAVAEWELYQTDQAYPQGRKVIASGSLPNPPFSTDRAFRIKLGQHLPLKNQTGQDQIYFVHVLSKANVSDTVQSRSVPVRLIHKADGTQVIPTPSDPYTCPTDNPAIYARTVKVEMPIMTVLHTTTTSGDGDRDEVYLNVSQLGPGLTSSLYRLPDKTGLDQDDYYEGKQGQTVEPGEWTNRDEETVEHPLVTYTHLQHGDVKTVSVLIQEQDNSDLASIKAGLITSMNLVAGVSGAIAGYGQIVAGAAQGIAGVAQLLPATSGHDVIGFYGLQITNRCGFIQTVWVAPSSSNGIHMNFIDVSTHTTFESRLAVLNNGSLFNFYPFGVDFGAFNQAGPVDQFWLETNGTSGSKYRFLLKASVLP